MVSVQPGWICPKLPFEERNMKFFYLQSSGAVLRGSPSACNRDSARVLPVCVVKLLWLILIATNFALKGRSWQNINLQ